MVRLKIHKKKGKCPICSGPTRKRYVLFSRSEEYFWVTIECRNRNKCCYSYASRDSTGTEVIGFIVYSWDFCTGDNPGFNERFKMLRELRNIRKRSIAETRALITERDSLIILECFLSPNANKPALCERLYQWVSERQDRFPLNHAALKSLKEKYDRYAQERKQREDDHHRDDNQQDSSGGSE